MIACAYEGRFGGRHTAARTLPFAICHLVVSVSASAPYIWPERTWALRALTADQYSFWETEGYLVIPNAVPLEITQVAAATVRSFVGANDSDAHSWYENKLDIYKDRLSDGKHPHHGPCGMAWLYHHESLWAIRQHPRLHDIFSDLYGTRRLFVTIDRVHFKPPQHPAYPEWSDAGEVHVGLHWDVDTREVAWPVPFVMQGVVYLEDTKANQGALRVVPGFHRQLERWSAAQPFNRSAERPSGLAAEMLAKEAVAVEGAAGSLVIWHSLLPHGPAPNLGLAPRISAYVSMLPVDASRFLGPTRPPDAPLSMADAGTLSYLEDLSDIARPEDNKTTAVHVEPGDSGSGTCDKVGDGNHGVCGGMFGKPGMGGRDLRRQTRERRAERWSKRLPLLDEDPKEEDLPHRPPGEDHGRANPLTSLGKRLVGLLEWESDADLAMQAF